MASFADNTTGSSHFKWQVGLETDIGGGRENQDDCFVWIKRDDDVIVLCVLDGHGREVGKIASESAKMCLFKHLDENYQSLLQAPAEFLVNAHVIAHEHIRESFRTELTRQGYEVVTAEGGYLMKRRQAADNWACVHGGTSCSIVALVRGELYIANVGDSAGILCSAQGPLFGADLEYMHDSAVATELNRLAVGMCCTADNAAAGSASPVKPASSGSGNNNSNNNTSASANGNSSNSSHSSSASGAQSPSNSRSASAAATATASSTAAAAGCSSSGAGGISTLLVTAEHSPECPYEYSRLHRFRARDGNATLPALVVVYDSSSNDKTRCAPVFERNAAGEPFVTNKGSYYKNVRREWASLVSTPPYAQFQDALAFTRSLGDLHLHTYGVSHLPEVQRIDLQAVFRRLEQPGAGAAPASTAGASAEGPVTEPATTSDSPASSSSGAGAGAGTGAAAGGDSAAGLTAEAVARSTLCVVLATDGVWDNWTYEDVGRFVMDPSCLGAVGGGADGAKRVTISFMQRNALYAKRNFGSNADNATGIVLYISKADGFPAL